MTKIILSNVGKKFAKMRVLEKVNMELSSGNIYGLIGPNGCGKTVLLKIIAGFVRATEGTVALNGKIIGKDLDFPPSMGTLIENPGFLPSYTGMNNLYYLARIKNKINRKDVLNAMDKVNISYAADRKVREYSLGMRQRLGIAQAIMENPEILLLDEPMNGLDKDGIVEIRNLIQDMKSQGKLIILASHTNEDIEILCDRVYRVENCRVSVEKEFSDCRYQFNVSSKSLASSS